MWSLEQADSESRSTIARLQERVPELKAEEHRRTRRAARSPGDGGGGAGEGQDRDRRPSDGSTAPPVVA